MGPSNPSQPGLVSSTPADGTPHLAVTGHVEQIRQLVDCGGTMYAVGDFTKIGWQGKTYQRDNAFSFSDTAPYTVTPWNPDVSGAVNTIAFNGTSCDTAYLGGQFKSVHGTRALNIAAVSTITGRVDSRFQHNASAAVNTIASHNGHLLVGGFFKSINGSSNHSYMASLDPTTGAVQNFINLNISGSYSYCYGGRCAVGNRTKVFNQQLSHQGSLDLVEGDFTSVGGRPRQQIFMLDLEGLQARVTAWTSPAFDDHCWFDEPFYLRAASWSPNDSTVYVATTGFHLYDKRADSFPLSGLCDAAAAFPARQAQVNRKWINYTGCDSLYATVADASVAYFGGHERWSENSRGCNFQGPGAYPAPGMEALHPNTGDLYLNSTGTAGYYSKSRGLGADDMLLTDSGLWIASDNADYGQCGSAPNHAGVCFLPYQGS